MALDMADEITGDTALLSSGLLSAQVAALGAELVRLRDPDGRELLWHGDPQTWAGRAPLLFPIVGRLPDDTLIHQGRHYGMKQHGFARRSRFTRLSAGPDRAVFRLQPDAQIEAQYPFPFTLDVTYALAGDTLRLEAELFNPGPEELPASFGFHPGVLWPLPYGGARSDHRLIFETPEDAPVHRLCGGLLAPEQEPNPAAGAILAPDDALFARDALIFLAPRSRRIRFGVPGRPGLEIAFPHMPHLGIWSKPQAPFLCIEPWQGHATPQGPAQPFITKPGLVHLPAGGTQRFAMSIRWMPDIGPERFDPRL